MVSYFVFKYLILTLVCLFLPLALTESTDICNQPLGLENGVMGNDQILFPISDNDKTNSRLNSPQKSCTDANSDSEILRYDFKRIMKVTGFSIQSSSGISFQNFEFRYGIASANDLVPLRYDHNNTKRKYPYPKDASTLDYKFPKTPIIVRYLQVNISKNRSNRIRKYCTKMEFYGCPEVCSDAVKPKSISLVINGTTKFVKKYNASSITLQPQWCINKNEVYQYLFEKTFTFTGFSVLKKSNTDGKLKFHVKCSTTYGTFKYVNNISKVFGGSAKKDGMITIWFPQQQICKAVELIPVETIACIQVQLIGCYSDCMNKQGIENGDQTLLNYEASSSWNSRNPDTTPSGSNKPGTGRLNSLRTDWAPDKNDPNGERFWQACLDKIVKISGIFIQGQGFWGFSHIDSFVLQYSYAFDVTRHEYISNDTKMIFNGVPNRYETHYRELPTPIFARCLRLYANCTKSAECAARFEYAGCRTCRTCETVPLPKPKVIESSSNDKMFSCSISTQPEKLEWFIFNEAITSTMTDYTLTSTEKDLVKYGYKNITLEIRSNLTKLIPTYKVCSDDVTRKTFICSANYTCRANYDNNLEITISSPIVLTTDYKEIPAKPVKIKASQINATSVELSWEHDLTDKLFPIVRYYLQISQENSNIPQYAILLESQPKVLRNLKPFTNYAVFVKSANQFYNMTGYYEGEKFRTDEGVSSPPVDLSLVSTTESSLTFQWKKPLISNGNISSYKIFCSRSNGSEVITKVETNNITLLQTTIYGFASGTEYICKVQALTKVGTIPGKWSVDTLATTKDGGTCWQPFGLESKIITDSQLTASFDKSSHVSMARLNQNFYWCAQDSYSYLTIDFGSIITVRGIALQGNMMKEWFISLKYKVFGSTSFVDIKNDVTNVSSGRKFYHPGGIETKRHWFHESAFTLRYLEIHIVKPDCLRLEFYGCSEVCSTMLPPPIPSTSLATLANTNNEIKWCQLGMEYKFSDVVTLTGVMIKGNTNPDKIINFNILYQNDTTKEWKLINQPFRYQSLYTQMTYWFTDMLVTHGVKLQPIQPFNNECLQITFIGCQSGCMNKLGIEKNKVGITFHDDGAFLNSKPENGCLNLIDNAWTPFGNTVWIQVCLPASQIITGIAIQGQGGKGDGYVKTFKLQYGYSYKSLYDYKLNKTIQIFTGATNRYSTKVMILPFPVTAKCLRLLPKDCNNKVCAVRWEFLGCVKGGSPIMSKISSTTAMKGDDISLSFNITGQPGVDVRWSVSETDVTNSLIYRSKTEEFPYNVNGVFESKLTINKRISTNIIHEDIPCVQDKLPFVKCYLNYTATAFYENSQGDKRSETKQLFFTGYNASVEPPGNIVLYITNTTVKIQWTNTSNGGDFPIKEYVLEIDYKDTVIKSKTGVTETNFKFYNIEPYRNYKLLISSINRLKLSSKVIEKNFITKEGVPSDVRNLTVSFRARDQIKLQWKTPHPPNGVISNYIVKHKEKDTLNIEQLNVTADTTAADGLIATSFEKLKNYQSYLYRVRAFTSKGLLAGPWTQWLEVKTLEGVPSEPQNVIIQSSTVKSCYITWKEPAVLNGVLSGYKILYNGKKTYNQSFQHTAKLKTNDTSVNITDLTPATNYTFAVYGITGGGVGSPSQMLNVTMPYSTPYAPNVTVLIEPMQYINLNFDPVSDINGPINSYQLAIEPANEDCISKLVRLHQMNEPPLSLMIFKGEENVLLPTGVKFKLLLAQKYQICYRAVSKDKEIIFNGTVTKKMFERNDLKKISNGSVTPRFKSIDIELTQGPPNTKYYQIVVIEGNVTNLVIKPESLKPYSTSLSKDKPYVTAEFLAEDFNKYQKFVVGDNSQVFPKVATSYRSKRNVDISSHYENNVDDELRLRRNVDEMHYVNIELNAGTFYSILQVAYEDKDTYYTTPWINAIKTKGTAAVIKPPPGDQTILIVSVCIVMGLIFASIIAGVFIYRKRQPRSNSYQSSFKGSIKESQIGERRSNTKSTSFAEIGEVNNAMEPDEVKEEDILDRKAPSKVLKDSRYPPIKLLEFNKQYEKIRKDSCYLLSTEYKALNSGQQYRWKDAIKPEIKTKNRYANIVAYDHSRVKLNKTKDDDNDYINASFINGYNTPNMYIASQGPNEASVNDFWKMIWEQEVPVIVMVTNLIERSKKKCHQYWPSSVTQKYGDIEVTIMLSDTFSDYVIRKFSIKKTNSKEKREVHQYHYLSWPDHGVPEFPSDIINLRCKVRKVFPIEQTDRPILIHCSAGVGRTGTFICIDTMLHLAKQKQIVDVFNYVNFMRTRRIHMIQTEDQYAFVYRALFESFTCGLTEINAPDISIETTRLLRARNGDQKNGYELQYEKLASVIQNHLPKDTTHGLKNENKEKNRQQHILPRDDSRVVLHSSVYNDETSDYINASYINGYKEKQAFISTHHPLESTTNIFWQMIVQCKVGTIVLLNQFYEEDGNYPPFFPSVNDTQSFKYISVKCEKENEQPDYTAYKFNITHTKEPQTSSTCNLIHYKQWSGPEQLPKSSASLINLLNAVEKSKYKSKEQSPVVIICSDGVSRCGTYIASSIVLEYLKLEQSVDVFQSVRKIRSFRSQFVANSAHYKFIYDVILAYIDSFNTYSNYAQ